MLSSAPQWNTGRRRCLYEEEGIALLAVGSMVKTAEAARLRLKERGLSCTLVNARFVKPVDEEMIERLARGHRLIVTLEENVASGGFGERVRTFADEKELPAQILSVTIPDEYVEHGNVELLKKEIGIDEDTVTKRILEAWEQK